MPTYHVLALANGAIVLNAADDLSLGGVAAEHGEHQTSVGDEDGLSGLHRRGKSGVRARELLVVALEVVVGSEGDVLALGELDLFGAVSEKAGADLGPLGVEEDAYCVARSQ